MNNPGNILAVLALLAWPGVVIVLFRMLPLERALIWSILGGYMFLPQITEFDLPLIPPFDKTTIPNLTAFACCLAIWGRVPSLFPQSWLGRGLMAAFLLSPAATVLTNLTPVQFGIDQIGSMTLIDRGGTTAGDLPGLRFHDSFSALTQQILLMLPFFLARQALCTAAGMREILVALVIAAAIYAPLMLFEVRFSPQLHTLLYGFFQHDFVQAIRMGGFRPFVFMPHGLWVAFFVVMALAAALALWRQEKTPLWAGAVVMVLGMLVITKTMGAYLFALVLIPVALFLPPRLQLFGAAAISLVVIAYPALRGLDLIPTEALVAKVAEVSADRAQSLGYRFGNEDQVLAHAESRPWLGWGGWGRFVPHNPETGTTDIVVDGQWIITIATNGWLGFAAMFGLLALPLWALAWQSWRTGQAPPLVVTVLAFVLAMNMFDLLPNATLIPFTWLIAGALLGHAEQMARDHAARTRARLAELHGSVVLGRLDGSAAGARRTYL